MPEVTCPLCGTAIPMVASDRPNSEGLSTGLDDRLVEEHINMHRYCTCEWRNGDILKFNLDCPVHFDTPLEGDDEPDDVFAVELTED